MTVTELAERLSIGASTLRDWTRTYGQFLSESATPKSGRHRKYTKQDEIVLGFIFEKRRVERISEEEVIAALGRGEVRGYVPKHWREPEEDDLMRELVNVLQSQMDMLREDKEYLRRQWEQEREARLLAEKKAALYDSHVRGNIIASQHE